MTVIIGRSGNQGEYRIGLIAQGIGEESWVWLDEHRNNIKKWSKRGIADIIKSLSIL